MNIYVISGVTGMTGSELAQKLVNRGDKVIGFDNFFASSINSVISIVENPLFLFFEYDINSVNQMQALETYLLSETKNQKLIYINCAAIVHTEYFYQIDATFETNVIGMRSFLDQAIRLKAQSFINCSTSEVYSMESWNENGGIRESDFIYLATAEHSQRTSYAAGKLLTEFFIKDAVDKNLIEGCSIRFANVYSNNELYPKHIIPHIINSLRKNGKVTLLENSKVNKRTFLHNIDSCSSVMALADTPLALDGSVYNVATDQEISIVDLVDLIAKKMGLESAEIVFEGYRSSDPVRRILNTEKISKRTNWKPLVNLDEGLDMCINNSKI